MSKHHHHHECCYPTPMTGYGMAGYGMTGYGAVGYGGGGSTSWGIRWIYALLILIVIVLQFGRRDCVGPFRNTNACEGDGAVAAGGLGFFGNNCEGSVIDRSVLFIIVVFLLVLCAGCWWGGGASGAGGYGGYGGGGCGMY